MKRRSVKKRRAPAKRSLRTLIAAGIGVSATLLLPLSGLTVPDAAADSPAGPLPAVVQPREAVGTVTPNTGSTAGGEQVTITIDNPPQIVSSAHGDGFGLAVTSDGDVVTWGAGEDGQLGDGQSTSSLTPVLLGVEAFGGQPITQVAAGGRSAYALTDSGAFYAWGAATQTPVPTNVPLDALDGAVSNLVAAGEWAYLLSDTGTVYGSHEGSGPFAPIVLLQDQNIVDLAASPTNVIAATANSQVWTADVASLAADGFSVLVAPDPPQSEPVPLSLQASQVAAGDGWFGIVDSAGQIFTWSEGESPRRDAHSIPRATQLDMSGWEAIVLAGDGEVFFWGRGDAPRKIDGANFGRPVEGVAAAPGVLSVLGGGSVFGWGKETDFSSPTLLLDLWPVGISFGGVQAPDKIEVSERRSITVQTPAVATVGDVDVVVAYSVRVKGDPGDTVIFRTVSEVFGYEGNEDIESVLVEAPGGAKNPGGSPNQASAAAPLALSAGPASVAPKTVWTETFEQPPPQNWENTSGENTTDTGTLANYVGVPPSTETADLGGPWHIIRNCVGMRLPGNEPLPFTGNIVGVLGQGYCGALSYSPVANISNRTKWWNVARRYAIALGGEQNNVGAFLRSTRNTAANPGQDDVGMWTQTPVYATKGLDFIEKWVDGNGDLLLDGQDNPIWAGLPDWDDQVESRFYSGSFDTAASGAASTQAQLGMWIYPSSGAPERAVQLFPEPVLPITQGTEVSVAEPTPVPSATDGRIMVGAHTSDENGLFPKSDLRDFVVKITDNTASSTGNKFAIDNISLIDVTPTLHKEYVAENEQAVGTGGEHKLVQVRPGDERVAELVFRVVNTGDFQKKEGWGFTETLPQGLTAKPHQAKFEGCGAPPEVESGVETETIVVSRGTLSAGAANAICTIRVPVEADDFALYTSDGTLPTETVSGATGTSVMHGVYKPNKASVEFWQFDLNKEAYEGENNVNGASEGSSDARVNPGSIVTYDITLNNPSENRTLVFGEKPASYPNADQIWVGAGVQDFLGDVFDDADPLDANGSPVSVSVGPYVQIKKEDGSDYSADFSPTYYEGAGSSPAQPSIILKGEIPPGEKLTITFRVKVKPSADGPDHTRLDGWERPPAIDNVPNMVGYQLNNYVTVLGITSGGEPMDPVVPASCPPQESFGSDQDHACTHTQVRAWTIQKNSLPHDGEPVHSNVKIYYRLDITNVSSGQWGGVVVNDDLTDVLSKAIWDRIPQNAWGIEFWNDAGDLIGFRPGWTGEGTKPENPFKDSLSEDAQKEPIVIWPEFTCEGKKVGDAGFDQTDCYGARNPTDPDYTLWNNDASWELKVGAFNIPADAKTVTIGYVVNAGYAAKPEAPDTKYTFASGNGGGTHQVPAPPNSALVNAMWADEAESDGVGILPIQCANEISAYDDVLDPQASPCMTYHPLVESFFHIRKHGLSGGQIVPDVGQAEFLISDTYDEALSGEPSKWLCYENNNPCGVDGKVVPPQETTGPPDPPACESDVIAGEWPDFMDAGSCTADAECGEAEYGEDSPAHAAIQDWNALANVYNSERGYEPGDLRRARIFEQCGLFYEHEEGDSHDEAQPGTWHVQDLKGGEDADWRTDTANNTGIGPHDGVYWLTETKAPSGYQLFARPQQFWVAPSTLTPEGLSGANPGDNFEFFDYQGRVSMPVVGVGEGGGSYSDQIRGRCGDWCELPTPTVPPADNQPMCACNNGWNVHVFDAQTASLPFSGGLGVWWLVLLGGVVFAGTTGVVVWRRHKRLEAETSRGDAA